MIGKLAHEYCKLRLQLQVLKSAAGYYIGTCNEDGPVSRESNEYWRSQSEADSALAKGDWTQLEI